MRELAAIQGDFQDYLLRGEGAIERHVLGSARVPVKTRLGIYGGAYRSRLIEALGVTYAALAKLLDEDFAALADEYVRTHDSRHFSIRYYGEDFAVFLAAHEDTRDAPLLAELARWEWAMTGAFDAADAAALAPEALARVSPEQWAQLHLTFHPSVARLALHWNAPQIWQALSEEAERPAASFSATALEWLLWREDLTTYFRSLGAAEAKALDAARAGAPFGELCELLCDEVGEQAAPAQAATLLRGWIGSGLITRAA